MLRPREPQRQAATPRMDGVSSITVLLLTLVAGGLLVAAILATYDYSTPSAELPLVTTLSAVAGAALAINVVGAVLRHLVRR